jgi:hypothetical protein
MISKPVFKVEIKNTLHGKFKLVPMSGANLLKCLLSICYMYIKNSEISCAPIYIVTECNTGNNDNTCIEKVHISIEKVDAYNNNIENWVSICS